MACVDITPPTPHSATAASRNLHAKVVSCTLCRTQPIDHRLDDVPPLLVVP